MNKKGFTLIEVLIVVVIIAVLASLVMPKLLPQTERAVVAEAMQTLGVLQRSQNQLMDMTGNENWTTANDTAAIKTVLNVEIKSGAKYNYSCNTSHCMAMRANNGSKTISLAKGGGVACVGYTAVKDPDDNTIGCA